MPHPLLHLQKHKKTSKHSLQMQIFEDFMFVAGLVAPLMTLFQVIDIWKNHLVQGVSLTTWLAYTISAALWTVYGFLHKSKALIASQFLFFIFNSAVVLGILLVH